MRCAYVRLSWRVTYSCMHAAVELLHFVFICSSVLFVELLDLDMHLCEFLVV